MFCRIYTTGPDIDKEILVALVSNAMNGPLSDGYLEHEEYSIDVDLNEEYDHDREKEFPDGFLYFKYSIEIEFVEDIKRENLLSITNKILVSLWNSGYPAVASCDYEEELLLKGGYKNVNIPWPE